MSDRPLNILLVEDNPDHAELVRRDLEKLHGVLRHVEDGEAAIDYISGRGIYADRAHFPAPDLVLLDLRLPRVDGLEVLRHVKRHPTLHRTLVVMLTTSDAERDVAMAFVHHADGFLIKPVDFQSLAHLLKDLGFYPSAWNKNPPPPTPRVEP